MPEYEYKDLVAETWDVLRGDTSNWPDRLFYKNLIQQYGEPVDLETIVRQLLLLMAALIDKIEREQESVSVR